VEELSQRKQDLRARMRGLRDSIPLEERLRLGSLIQENVFRLPEMGRAGTVLLFYSFGSEVPTAAMIQRLLDQGVRVLLPFLQGSAMDAAELRPGDLLAATTYGPREPSSRAPVNPSGVDVVIAPGLAFDAHGYRLGYGGGHYDRYLSRLGPGTLRLGIAFHFQVVPSVPQGPEDLPLDLVVTDGETIDCRTHPDPR
jgi:5-formyltetrahydrofolate cyclo-ligase